MPINFHNTQSKTPNQEKPRSPFKRNIPRWQWYLLSLIIMSPLIYFFGSLLYDAYFIVAPGYITFDKIAIRAPNDGYISDVFVKIGAKVHAGQKILLFNSPMIDKEIEGLKKEFEVLKNLEKKTLNKQRAMLMQMEKEAMQNVKETEKQYNKFSSLQGKGIVTLLDLRNSWNDVHKARIELQDIRRRIHENQGQHTISLESQFREKLRKTKTKLAQLEHVKKLFLIKAPKEANVINVFTHSGEFVKEGQELVLLSTNKNFHIRAFLEPKFIDQVHKGKEVTIILPDRTRIPGVIVNSPTFAEREPNTSVVFTRKKSSIVIIINTLKPVNVKYQVFGVPVKVQL